MLLKMGSNITEILNKNKSISICEAAFYLRSSQNDRQMLYSFINIDNVFIYDKFRHTLSGKSFHFLKILSLIKSIRRIVSQCTSTVISVQNAIKTALMYISFTSFINSMYLFISLLLLFQACPLQHLHRAYHGH